MFSNYGIGRKIASGILIVLAVSLALPAGASAHCDRVNGPVATAAREALKTGDLQPVAIWVGKQQEGALRKTFKDSLQAYREGGTGKEIAKRFFMSEAVRLHRAAEGMPFTGLKPASDLPRDLKLAERALETGNFQPVVDLLTEKFEREGEKWLKKSRAAKRKMEADGNLEAGRRWADAYVKYIVYVHTLHQNIQAGPPHGVGGISGGTHGQ